jgi:glyoxylase-like metal-dependent hydrolase (beta-lactamase superfamily II)
MIGADRNPMKKLALVLAVLIAPLGALAHHKAPPPPKSVRLYVFNCGSLNISDPERFRFKKEELATTNLSVGCYLIVHPKGTLMWDVGAVPDDRLKPGAKSALEGYATITQTLESQMENIGYEPEHIEYLAFSHYHYDHIANANLFANSTWLVRKVERDAMFAAKPPDKVLPANYYKLKDSKTVIIPTDDYDVFGDGTVVMKLAPGHTPGHQVLFLKLKKTGPIVLSGDLYHYPEERKLGRVPTFETDQQQTVETRKKIEEFLKESGAQLWIQHDYAANAKLKKAPLYYE